MITRAQIVKKIGNPHLSLYDGDGYFYFVYEDGKGAWGDRSVYVYRLNHLSLDRWVDEGNDFIKEMEAA